MQILIFLTVSNKAEFPWGGFDFLLRFVRNCREFQNLYDLLYDASKADWGKYGHALQALKGQGRLWITGSRTTHAHDSSVEGNGAIEWMKFSVEIKLPNVK